jgi:uncharacterized protein
MIYNPCVSCGACCAFFRVSFHWLETDSLSFHVPLKQTVVLSPHLLAMRGTDQKDPRCESLVGEIGKKVQCDIYENRPEVCRSFKASFQDGEKDERCDKARLSKGFKILTLSDWTQLK